MPDPSDYARGVKRPPRKPVVERDPGFETGNHAWLQQLKRIASAVLKFARIR